MRVFFDRLIDDKDREWLFNEIRFILHENFKESFDAVFKDLSNSTVHKTQTDCIL